MKLISVVLLAIIFTSLHGADLVTRTGAVYHNYRIVSHDAGYVTIMYRDGGGRIPLKDLPGDLQKELGYDPAAADQFVARYEQSDREQRMAVLQAETAGTISTPIASAAEPSTATGSSSVALGASTPTRGSSPQPDVVPSPSAEAVSRPAPTVANADLNLGDDPLRPGYQSLHPEGEEGSSSNEDSGRVVWDTGYVDGYGGVTYVQMTSTEREWTSYRHDWHGRNGTWMAFVDTRGGRHLIFREMSNGTSFAGTSGPGLQQIQLPSRQTHSTGAPAGSQHPVNGQQSHPYVASGGAQGSTYSHPVVTPPAVQR